MPTVIEQARDTAQNVLRGALFARMRMRGGPLGELLDPRTLPDPYPFYERMRARGPVVRTDTGALVVDHATIEQVLRHPDTTTATTATQVGEGATLLERLAFATPDRDDLVEPISTESMIGVDGADHARLRRLTTTVFTPAAVAGLRPRLAEIVGGLLDEATTKPTFDLMGDVARTFPVLAICEVLGIPTADHTSFTRWGQDLAVTLDGGVSAHRQRRATAALEELNDYMRGLVERRRRDPGDDLVSGLANVQQDGDSLTDREVLATAILLLVAGFETTVNLIGNGTLALARHPEQEAWLRQDVDGRAKAAVEEMLRFDPPVQLTARHTGMPLRTDDGEVPVGTEVLVMLAAGNRDPEMFDAPATFDLSRPNARRHLSFASGPHYCLGAALSRLEGEVYLRELLARVDRVEMAGPARRRRSFALRGLRTLPLVGRR